MKPVSSTVTQALSFDDEEVRLWVTEHISYVAMA